MNSRLLSILIFLTFTWTSLAQALPFPNDSITETSLTAQTAVSLASNKGDLDKALRSVTSKEAFQSIGIAMVSAGVAQGLNTYFKIPLNPSAITDLTKHAAYHSTAMISNMAAEAVIAGKTDGKGAALKAIASTLGSKLANVIGDLNACGEIDFFTHKALHALKGAAEGRIIGGKKGMEAGALGAFIAETVAEAITPTHGIDKMKAKDQPDYSEDRLLLTKNVSKVVAALVAAAAGMDPTQVSIAVLSATTSLDCNFEHSAKGIKDGEKEDEEAELSLVGHLEKTTGDFGKHDALPPAESAQQNTTILTIGGTEFDVVAHVANHPGMKRRTLSLNSLYLHEQLEQAEVDLNKSSTFFESWQCSNRINAWKLELEGRQIHRTAENVKNYAQEHPYQMTALGLTTAAAVIAFPPIAALAEGAPIASVSLELTAAASFGALAGNLRGHDYCREHNLSGLNALAHNTTQTLTGAMEPFLFGGAPLRTGIAGASLYTVGMGMNTLSPESGAELQGLGMGLGFGSVASGTSQLYAKFTHATKGCLQKITMNNAHFISASDDLLVRSAVNSNIRPAANLDRMSVSHVLTEASEVNGIQGLAQQHIGGGSGAAGMKPATMSGSAESGLLNLTKPKTGLLEGANEASAAYKRVQANMASPASVVSGDLNTTQATRNPVWDKGPVVRGNIIEKEVGQNLPPTFPTLDRMVKGNATSIKSRDLDAKTYLNPTKLRYQLKKDIDKLADFTRGQISEIEVKLADIKQKILDVHVPHEGHSMQRAVFDAMQEYAAAKDIILNINVY